VSEGVFYLCSEAKENGRGATAIGFLLISGNRPELKAP
jgi:hypothetical protein